MLLTLFYDVHGTDRERMERFERELDTQYGCKIAGLRVKTQNVVSGHDTTDTINRVFAPWDGCHTNHPVIQIQHLIVSGDRFVVGRRR